MLYTNMYNIHMHKIDMTKCRLKELREEKNLTQRQLATMLGISQANISRWEAGLIVPNVLDCWRMAEFFNVTIDYFIGKESD